MLAPLFALLRKDRPWIVAFAIAGLLTAFGAVLFADPVELLLLEPWAAQATFWIALAGGLLLGAFAGVFDELLGTRELLWQRPVSARQLAAARIAAVAVVLLAWHLAIPLVLLLWWPFAAAEGLSVALGSWLEQQASVAIAWPCALAMLFAATLPVGWLLRLVIAGACFYAEMLLIDGFAKSNGQHEPGLYLALSVAVAALFAALQLGLPARRPDPDRPFAGSLPLAQRWAMVGAVGLVAAAATIEWESQWIRGVYSTYPQPHRQGRAVVLVAPVPPKWEAQIVDAEHRPLGGSEVRGPSLGWSRLWPWLQRDNEFKQPRWATRYRRSGSSWFGPEVRVASDGSVWLERRTRAFVRRFERLATDGDVSFSRGAELVGNGESGAASTIVIGEPGAPQVWRLDAHGLRLVAVPLPDGDRVQRVERVQLSEERLAPAELAQWRALVAADAAQARQARSEKSPDQPPSNVVCVVGERSTYALVGGALRPFPADRREGPPLRGSLDSPDSEVARLDAEDPLVFTRSLPATAEHDGLVHEFRPRTRGERLGAAFAMAVSSLRPPVLQAVAHVAPAGARPGWLFDGLVAGGRRPWLVLLQCAIAAMLAFGVRRWLVRHGVPSGAWVAQIVVFGVPAFLLFVYVECPRRVVAREVALPAPPRIASLRAG